MVEPVEKREKQDYREGNECKLPEDKSHRDCSHGKECLAWGCVDDHCQHVVGRVSAVRYCTRGKDHIK